MQEFGGWLSSETSGCARYEVSTVASVVASVAAAVVASVVASVASVVASAVAAAAYAVASVTPTGWSHADRLQQLLDRDSPSS